MVSTAVSAAAVIQPVEEKKLSEGDNNQLETLKDNLRAAINEMKQDGKADMTEALRLLKPS